MSRLVGAVLVVLAAAGIGNELAGEVKRRLNALYQCKTLVTFLQSQIRYAVSEQVAKSMLIEMNILRDCITKQ